MVPFVIARMHCLKLFVLAEFAVLLPHPFGKRSRRDTRAHSFRSED